MKEGKESLANIRTITDIELKELLVQAKRVIPDRVKYYAQDMDYKFIDIDGVRIEVDDGFALIRGSNTQPILTLRFEANTKDRLSEIKMEFMNLIDSIVGDLN